MKCTDLAERIERLCPAADARDVARLCLLLTNSTPNVDELCDDVALTSAWTEMDRRMRAATEEHEALAADLSSHDAANAKEVSAEQIWHLIETIRAQSRILELYLGNE